MKLHSFLLFICLLTLPIRAQDASAPRPDEAAIRKSLGVEEGVDLKDVSRAGGFSAEALPIYARILDNQAEGEYLIQRTLWLLSLPEMKGDRSQFVDRAVTKLAHQHSGVRQNAIDLLGKIGSTKDAQPIVASLYDRDRSVSNVAAKTLVVLGDRRSLAAFDVWLASGHFGSDRDLRERVAKCRDDLWRRLDKEAREPKTPPPTPTPPRP